MLNGGRDEDGDDAEGDGEDGRGGDATRRLSDCPHPPLLTDLVVAFSSVSSSSQTT